MRSVNFVNDHMREHNLHKTKQKRQIFNIPIEVYPQNNIANVERIWDLRMRERDSSEQLHCLDSV